MATISAQKFRNAYEKLYASTRNYLWPYEVLEQLALLEVNIYSAFLDMNAIDAIFSKLESSMKDVAKEDEELRENLSAIRNLINVKNPVFYHKLVRVSEANPEVIKSLKIDKED